MKKYFYTLGMALLVGRSLQAEEIVRVPVPDDLKLKGKLLVAGEKGSQQSGTFQYQRCSLKANVEDLEIAKDGCSHYQDAPLNKKVILRPGYYLLKYSNTVYENLVEVKSNQLLTVKLSKILVPQEKGKYTFNVFRDLTSEDEQDKLAREYWGDGVNFSWIIGFCNQKPDWEKDDSVFSSYCKAAKTNEFEVFKSNYFRFYDDARWAIVHFTYNTESLAFTLRPYFKANSQLFVVDPEDGEFVSVFPGTYGLVFQNVMEDSSTTYGVKVTGAVAPEYSADPVVEKH